MILVIIIDDIFQLDFWKGPTIKKIPVDVMIAPHQLAEFDDILKTMHIDSEVFIEDVQQRIRATTPSERDASRSMDWTSYHRLDDINAWLDSLAEQYPDKVEVVVGGKSYEGRELKGVKVSFKEGNKAVFIEGGIHAREWIAPATVTYILNELLTSEDAGVRSMAESYDWYVFPSVNPDGFEYTFTAVSTFNRLNQHKCD